MQVCGTSFCKSGWQDTDAALVEYVVHSAQDVGSTALICGSSGAEVIAGPDVVEDRTDASPRAVSGLLWAFTKMSLNRMSPTSASRAMLCQC